MISISRIDGAVQRALAWMESRRCPGAPSGVMTSSTFHDPAAWPGMCLPATYNITNARILVAGIGSLGAIERRDIGGFISGFQDESGRFSLSGMDDKSIWKGPDRERTRNYVAAHVSNYARETLDRTAPDLLRLPEFYLEAVSGGIEAWLDERDWDDPWMEGNSVVNLAAGLAELGRLDLVDRLIEALNRRQDPSTGFWGRDLVTDRRRLLHGFAGAMHSFHLYYFRGAPLPNADRAVDAGLDLVNVELAGPVSACLDVDIVEMLASLWPANHRRAEIREVMAAKLTQMLDLQNDDGGFPDEAAGIRRFDGWVGGYWEPQGLSNGFATWFRLMTLAVSASVVFPELIDRWDYRRSIGIGYFDPSRLTEV